MAHLVRDDALQLLAVEREAQTLHSVAQRRAARVLAKHQVGLGHAHQGGRHDLVAKRVGQHAVLVNPRLVRKRVIAHNRLVR